MSNCITVDIDEPFCAENVCEETRFYVKKEHQNDELIWAIYSP